MIFMISIQDMAKKQNKKKGRAKSGTVCCYLTLLTTSTGYLYRLPLLATSAGYLHEEFTSFLVDVRPAAYVLQVPRV